MVAWIIVFLVFIVGGALGYLATILFSSYWISTIVALSTMGILGILSDKYYARFKLMCKQK